MTVPLTFNVCSLIFVSCLQVDVEFVANLARVRLWQPKSNVEVFTEHTPIYILCYSWSIFFPNRLHIQYVHLTDIKILTKVYTLAHIVFLPTVSQMFLDSFMLTWISFLLPNFDPRCASIFVGASCIY